MSSHPFDVLMSIASEAIVIVDETYTMKHATPSFHTEFSLEPKTAAGRPLGEVLPQLMTGAGLMQVLTTTQPLELQCLANHRHYRVRGRVGLSGSARFLALAFARVGAAPEECSSESLADAAELELRESDSLSNSWTPSAFSSTLSGLASASDPLVPGVMIGIDETPSPTDTPPGTPSLDEQRRAGASVESAADEDTRGLKDGWLASVAEKAEKKRLEASGARRMADRRVGADSEWLGNVSLMMRTHLNGIIGMHQLLSATGLTVEQAPRSPPPVLHTASRPVGLRLLGLLGLLRVRPQPNRFKLTRGRSAAQSSNAAAPPVRLRGAAGGADARLLSPAPRRCTCT
jgi:hypothetical protein